MKVYIRYDMPFTRLTIWCEKLSIPLNYEGACIGMLKGREFPLRITSLQFPFGLLSSGMDKPLDITIKKVYLEQLRKWGFRYFTDQVYRVSVGDKINMLEWFATFVVLRYVYENTKLVETWYKLIQDHPSKDPWDLFMLVHCYNNGHSLMHVKPQFYVNPVETLQKLKEKPGDQISFKDIGNLWGTFGGVSPLSNEDWNNFVVYDDLLQPEVFESKFAKILVLKEQYEAKCAEARKPAASG